MATRKKAIPIQPAEYCGNCRFYLGDGEEGICRHDPPTVLQAAGDVFTVKPKVEPSEWCGKHQGPRQ